MGSTNSSIRFSDSHVAGIIKLLGDVAGRMADLSSCKRLLLRGLGELLDADGWLWSATQVIRSENRPVSAGVLYEGLTEAQFNGWVEASQVAPEQPPEDTPLTTLLKKGEHFTRSRQQVVPDAIWYNHPTVQRYRLALGIDHFLYSIYPIGSRHCSAIGFFRRVGRQPFDDVQIHTCHLVVGSVEWIHRDSFPGQQCKDCVGLTCRQRTVLMHLLHGKSREEIARLLHISTNTAKSHIRAVYQHLGVDSQVKLMHCFHAGTGPAVAVPIDN